MLKYILPEAISTHDMCDPLRNVFLDLVVIQMTIPNVVSDALFGVFHSSKKTKIRQFCCIRSMSHFPSNINPKNFLDGRDLPLFIRLPRARPATIVSLNSAKSSIRCSSLPWSCISLEFDWSGTLANSSDVFRFSFLNVALLSEVLVLLIWWDWLQEIVVVSDSFFGRRVF